MKTDNENFAAQIFMIVKPLIFHFLSPLLILISNKILFTGYTLLIFEYLDIENFLIKCLF